MEVLIRNIMYRSNVYKVLLRRSSGLQYLIVSSGVIGSSNPSIYAYGKIMTGEVLVGCMTQFRSDFCYYGYNTYLDMIRILKREYLLYIPTINQLFDLYNFCRVNNEWFFRCLYATGIYDLSYIGAIPKFWKYLSAEHTCKLTLKNPKRFVNNYTRYVREAINESDGHIDNYYKIARLSKYLFKFLSEHRPDLLPKVRKALDTREEWCKRFELMCK